MDSDVPNAEPAPSAPASHQQSIPPTSLSEQSATSASSSRKHRQPTADRQHPEQSTEYQLQQEQSDAPSASSTYPTLTGISPQHDPSRDPDTMQRSVSPEEGSSGLTRYTKTGRVSKALKGQRVHFCEECGKTYTRKEHLKRHQQNHRPGAFPCDIPGCTRSFNREDLLVRHKQRHNEPSSRRVSVDSSNSGPGDEPPIIAPLRQTSSTGDSLISTTPQIQPAAPLTVGQQHDQRSSPRKSYLNLNELRLANRLLINTSIPDLHPSNGSLVDHSPVDFATTMPLYESDTTYQHFHRQLDNLHYGYPEYGGFLYHVPSHSRSPISAGSTSTIAHRHFFPTPQNNQFAHSGFDNSFSDGSYGLLLAHDPQFSTRITQEMMADARDLQERDELATPTTGPQTNHELDSSLDQSTLATEQRYLECYWKQVHPQYPVVFRPIFSLSHTSPLLKAAILALGGQAQGTRIDIENARILHDRCIRVIKKRTCSNQHTFRVVDMQALFLVELFAIFKARRFPATFTKSFEDMYSRLAYDEDCYQPVHVNDSAHAEAHSNATLHTLLRYDKEAKQRLLASCYILDNKCSLMFGRARSNVLTNGVADLIFPRSLASWDDENKHDVPTATIRTAMHATTQSIGLKASQLDGFQSILLLLHSLESTGTPLVDTLNDLNLLIGQHDWTRMAYHTLMLCKHVPMRDLLAVAGESWVMTEKISSQVEFIQSQLVTHNWAYADQQLDYSPSFTVEPNIQHALHHAFEILKIQSKLHTRTSLVCHEWSIYLAVIVVWARAYVTSLGVSIAGERRSSRPQLSIPLNIEPNTSDSEVRQTVSTLLHAGFATPLAWKETKNLLLWARHSVHSTNVIHCSGLTNMALDVLGKLTMRGNEEGWF